MFKYILTMSSWPSGYQCQEDSMCFSHEEAVHDIDKLTFKGLV